MGEQVVYTRESVLRLAPDASAAKSGQDLAQTRKWVTLCADDTAVWGECQGSGSKPYQVQVDLSEPAFKCSCPSRKFPCKHGLGLLLIYAGSPEAVTRAPRPAWVVQWLESRQARAVKASEKQSAAAERVPSDPQALADRRAKRLDRVRSGLGDLIHWTRDMVHAGLADAPGKGFDFFDRQARRMVDAQAPGVARLVRQLGSLAARGSDWQQPFTTQLARIHLLGRAVEGFDGLSDVMQADVQTVLGMPTPAEELDRLSAVSDTWQVLAQATEIEDRLRAQRTWLWGVRTRRSALLLQFAHGTAPFETTVLPGTQFEADVVFYPGNSARAALRSDRPSARPLVGSEGYADFSAALDAYSVALAAFPWLEAMFVPLVSVVPVLNDGAWWAIDTTGAALRMSPQGDAGYVLLAVSGGTPIGLAAEYDGHTLYPMAAICDGAWMPLTP